MGSRSVSKFSIYVSWLSNPRSQTYVRYGSNTSHKRIMVDNVSTYNNKIQIIITTTNIKKQLKLRLKKYSPKMIGLVLWHINHCRLFNAKFSLYIYIKYIGFGLVGFYGISTIVGYLMPNSLYTYILNI